MNNLNRQFHEVFYGWWIVAVFVFITAYVLGVISYGFTSFIGPLAKEFNWSYAEISIAASLRGFEGGFFAPVVGYLVDRWDARKMILAGVAIVGFGFLLFSRVTSLWAFYGAFVVIGAGMSTIYPVLPMVVVGRWFKRNVATAMGIVITGTSLAGLMVPLVTLMVDTYGWRLALVIFGTGVWCILLPLSLIVRDNPGSKYGYLLDDNVGSKLGSNKDVSAFGATDMHTKVGQALKNRAFWLVSIAVMLLLLTTSATTVHVMPYLNSIGMERSISSLVASALPLVSILGRLSSGWFGDRFDKRKVAATSVFLVSISMLIVGYFYTVVSWQLAVFVILFGIGWGGMIPMQPALIREYFSSRKLGTILGVSVGVATIGHIIGPPMAGWIFDRFDSYQYSWLVCLCVSIASLVSVLIAPSFNNKKTIGKLTHPYA